eukprot:771295-Amphidinium_carterae.1
MEGQGSLKNTVARPISVTGLLPVLSLRMSTGTSRATILCKSVLKLQRFGTDATKLHVHLTWQLEMLKHIEIGGSCAPRPVHSHLELS